MAQYKVYNSEGDLRCMVKSLEYTGKWMDDCYVSATIESHSPVSFALGDYIDFRGTRYVLSNTPSVTKNHSKLASSNSYVYDNVRFSSPNEDLTRCQFLDYVAEDEVLSDSKSFYSNSPSFSFFCEDVSVLAERIQTNLNRLYDNWEVLCVENFESAHNIHIQIDKLTVWDAALLINTKFKTCFVIKQRYDNTSNKRINQLIIGESLVLNSTMLEYGQGKGLTRIDRSKDDSSKIVNRLRVYGSKKNLPTRYYNEIYDPWYKMPLKPLNEDDETTPIYELTVDYPLSRELNWIVDKDLIVRNTIFTVFFGSDPSKKKYKAQYIVDSHNNTNNGLGFITLYHGYSGYWDIPYEERKMLEKGHTSLYIISGLTMGQMWLEKELWVNPRSMAPNEMAVSNLMLPSFLNYYGKLDGVIYELDCNKTYETKNEDGNVVSLQKDGINYEPIYLYDSKGTHLLDRYGNWMLKLKTDPYLENTDSINKYGVREGAVFFDSEDDSSETPEIYPTLTGLTKEMAMNAGYTLKLQSDDNGKLDEVFIGTDEDKYKITDDGVVDDDVSTEELKGDFFIEIKDLGFNLKDYWSDTHPVLKITSGDCGGREFEFIANNNNPIKLDDNNNYNSYQIRLKRSLDESLGRYFPNKDYAIKKGDKFVVINIDLPRLLIDTAAEKLLQSGQEYLNSHCVANTNISPTLDYIKLAKDYRENGTQSLYYQLREGCILQLKDENLGIEVSENNKYFIDTLTIKETPDKLPTVDVKLVKEKEYSTIQKIQNDIREVKHGGVSGITTVEATRIVENVGSNNFVNKKKDDVVEGGLTMEKTIIFKQGFETTELIANKSTFQTKDFTEGLAGVGYSLTKTNEGQSLLEIDELKVRKKMFVNELEIQRTTHIGGKQILSAARCTVYKVTPYEDYYQVYFLKTDGEGNEINNTWEVGDQAYMSTFNTGDDRYYWRIVCGIGEEEIDGVQMHYILLSNRFYEDVLEGVSNKQGYDSLSDEPQDGDVIVQLGNRFGTDGRTSAIELAGAGTDSPYIRQYEDITSFSLGDVDTQIKPKDNKFKGRVTIEDGSVGLSKFSDLPETVNNAVKIGGENLLRNTGFDGDYTSQRMEEFDEILDDSVVYSQRLEFWEVSNKDSVKSVESTDSVSGYKCSITNVGGWIRQSITLIPKENYVLSFVCDGLFEVQGSVFGSENSNSRCKLNITGTGESQTIIFKSASKNASVWGVKLERGLIQTDWCPAREDNDKMTDEFKDLWYLQHAFKGKTDILGGLILSSMIRLGTYRNGVMEQETSGVNGILNDANSDVAFWGGGTFEQAMKAVAMFKNDPTYQPTEEEVASIAKAVITHGGRAILNDIVLRGYVYALGGVFNGDVYASGGIFKGDVLAKRNILTRPNKNEAEYITKPIINGSVPINIKYLVVNNAFISGTGNYMLPDLDDGQMVEITWFNPPYSNAIGASRFRINDENTAGVAISTNDGIKFTKEVTIQQSTTLYKIIGDKPYYVKDNFSNDVKNDYTFWTISEVGTGINATDTGIKITDYSEKKPFLPDSGQLDDPEL